MSTIGEILGCEHVTICCKPHAFSSLGWCIIDIHKAWYDPAFIVEALAAA